jgi:hypothetical protein
VGVGSYSIDWLLQTKEKGDFLLEVKNRPGQSAQELTRLQSRSKTIAPKSNLGEPITDFDVLFKSSYDKFLPISMSSYIQGVILFLGIKIPADKLAYFFHSHLETKLHFVALGTENKDSGTRVILLATSPEISKQALSVFNWNDNSDLLY